MSQEDNAEQFVQLSGAYNSQASGIGFRWTDSAVITTVKNNIRFHEISIAPRISLQTTATPADRSLESLVDTSISIAAALSRYISTTSKIERITLIDDCHVPNTLDYSELFETLCASCYKPDQLVFQSSPLLHELALDVLRFLIKNSKRSKRFSVLRKDGKIFLKLTDNNICFELTQDFSSSFTIEGILFDTALSLFRRHHQRLIPLYAELHELPYGTDIHRSMFDYYTLTEPSLRICRLFLQKPYYHPASIDYILSSLEQTPYLNAIWNPAKPPLPHSLLVNISEAIERPLHSKLNKVLELLGEEPAYSVYFDPAGQLNIETSRLRAAHLEQKKRAAEDLPFLGMQLDFV